MTTISFYARGDSATANSPTINVVGTNTVPTTLLTFTSFGPNGDIQLEFNGGLPDPDTQVIINGETYSFTVVQTGTLPTTGGGAIQLADVNGVDLRGQRVIVIEANGVRYFFLPDLNLTIPTMDAIQGRTYNLENVVFGGPPILICFVTGTLILTPDGERPVESLMAGDPVLNLEGEAVDIVWIGRRRVTPEELSRHPELRPVRLPADLFGPGLPHGPLEVSPQHRILVEGWEVELAFGLERALVPAKHLVGGGAEIVDTGAAVDYFHLLFDRHEIVVSNGLPTESLQLSARSIRGLDPETRAELALLFPDGVPDEFADRVPAAPSLKAHEARLIAPAKG